MATPIPVSTLAALLDGLYDAILQKQPMAEVQLRIWATLYYACKDAWQDEHPTPPELKYVLGEMDYIVRQLLRWGQKRDLFGNRDARVFLEALTAYTTTLQKLWGEA
jgi:hypothetical protein